MSVSLRVRGRARTSFSAADRARLRRRAERILALLGRKGSLISVLVTDDDEIHALNREWRGKDRPTDVLSFSQLEGEGLAGEWLLGDVVISLETAARQSRRRRPRDQALAQELEFLLIHGTLHLLGHDHVKAAEAARMRAEELRIWRALGRTGPPLP